MLKDRVGQPWKLAAQQATRGVDPFPVGRALLGRARTEFGSHVTVGDLGADPQVVDEVGNEGVELVVAPVAPADHRRIGGVARPDQIVEVVAVVRQLDRHAAEHAVTADRIESSLQRSGPFGGHLGGRASALPDPVYVHQSHGNTPSRTA